MMPIAACYFCTPLVAQAVKTACNADEFSYSRFILVIFNFFFCLFVRSAFFKYTALFVDLPRWLKGKESTCQAGDPGTIPGLGRFLGEGNGNPLQYSCLGNPVDRGAWRATVHGVTESYTTDQLTHQY